VLGTTICPYLFFWQASQEAEDQREQPLRKADRCTGTGAGSVPAYWLDTWTGMALSNLVALAIMLTAGATLHAAGKTDIDSAQTAAEALRPVAGELSFLIFALGIIGTGFWRSQCWLGPLHTLLVRHCVGRSGSHGGRKQPAPSTSRWPRPPQLARSSTFFLSIPCGRCIGAQS
jgi:Natural resistance-associated macrophage protein